MIVDGRPKADLTQTAEGDLCLRHALGTRIPRSQNNMFWASEFVDFGSNLLLKRICSELSRHGSDLACIEIFKFDEVSNGMKDSMLQIK